jgi:hypothetical protein
VTKKVRKVAKKPLMLNKLSRDGSQVLRASFKKVQGDSFSQSSDKSLFMDKGIRLSFGKRSPFATKKDSISRKNKFIG